MRLNDRARRLLPWGLLALAAIVTAAVYWPGLTGGWVFDDFPNIVQNAAIHITPGHSTLAAWVNAALSSPASFLHRPLASITFALNWLFGGGDPWPFKLTNVIIHLINGVLLYCMLRALLRLVGVFPSPSGRRWPEGPDEGTASPEPETPRVSVPSPLPLSHRERGPKPVPLPLGEGIHIAIDDAAATRLALIVSAAWLLLPINLMAVLYVVQRMESLCQVFVLAGLWAYLHGRWMMLTATDARRDRHGFSLVVAGIVLGTLLGLTSKETAVLLPLFAFLAEWVLLRFRRNDIRDAGFEPSPGATRHPLPEGEGNESEPLSLRERGRGEGTDTRGVSTLRGTEPSPGAMRHPLPEGEGNSFEPLSLRERGRGEGTDTRGVAEFAPPSTSSFRGRSQLHRERNPESSSGISTEANGWIPGSARTEHGQPRNNSDARLWTLFVVTLFVPAVLGFAWLLRGVLRPGVLAGRDFTLGQRLLTEPRVLVDYLHWTIFPNPMVLSLYHDEIVKSTGWLTPWTTLGAMLLLAALIVVAILLRNRRPLVSLGIGWFFAAQLLTATIVPLELVYEQRMYFASIGVLLAVGALLLGLRWRIALPLLRGFIVAVALLWFATATNLRAREWSNPIRLAVAEANRHPESPRAVYEAGRQLLIASNYHEGQALTAAWKYLRQAAAIPGSSALSDQAMIMIADHHHQGADAAYWDSMVRKLRDQPTRQEDISALISLTNCYGSGICKFDVSHLQKAYAAALSRPHPIARLDGAYADFQRDILHDDALATEYLARAVAGAPGEPAYRVDLAALYARHGQTEKALEQIDALRRMNLAGRLDEQIAVLEKLAEQGTVVAPVTPSPPKPSP